MNGQSFVGNMPQPLNFADCSSAELDRKLMELWLMPLYHARYRKLDAPENPGLWYRVLEVQKQLSALEQLANKVEADVEFRKPAFGVELNERGGVDGSIESRS